jgi:hypothetical protein
MDTLAAIGAGAPEIPRFDDGMVNIRELIRLMAEALVNEIMDAQADDGNRRNGYRERSLVTSVVSIAASSGGDSAMRQCANPLAIGARLRRQSGWESFCSQPFFELSVARLPRSSR